MPKPKTSKDLNLKWLELFQMCAREGSMQAAAKEANLTTSTVSYHIKSLEDHLGIELLNHKSRPMRLTPKGERFLHSVDGILKALRKAKAEASAGDIVEASYLRIGIIEDFDSDVTPDLAIYMTGHMQKCEFLFHTDTSSGILDDLHNRELDIGVLASPSERLRDLIERPVLTDPFVLVLPRSQEGPVDKALGADSDLRFLRYSSNLFISKQIDLHLRRIGLPVSYQFECSNNQTLMAMVAAGKGWTISTPLLFSRAKRFHPRLKMVPFPGKSFSRTLSILQTPDCSHAIAELFADQLRLLIREHIMGPIHAEAPWLAEKFSLLD